MDRLIKPRELSEILGLGKSVVYRMLASGCIPCVLVTNGKRRRSFRVRSQELEKWVRTREVKNTL